MVTPFRAVAWGTEWKPDFIIEVVIPTRANNSSQMSKNQAKEDRSGSSSCHLRTIHANPRLLDYVYRGSKRSPPCVQKRRGRRYRMENDEAERGEHPFE